MLYEVITGWIVQVVSDVEELLEKIKSHECESGGESLAKKDELISQLRSELANLQNSKGVDIKAYEDMKELILDKVSKQFEDNNHKLSDTLTEHEQEMFRKLSDKLEREIPVLIEHSISEYEKNRVPWWRKIFVKNSPEKKEVEKEKELLKVKN